MNRELKSMRWRVGHGVFGCFHGGREARRHHRQDRAQVPQDRKPSQAVSLSLSLSLSPRLQ